MMNMMDTTGFGTGFAALWAVHALSVVLFAVGVILLILWAVKTLNQGQLKTWGIVLAVVGAILCLLTISVKGSPWGIGDMYGGASYGAMRMMDDEDDMMGGMMDHMMGGMDHSMMDEDDMMAMSMDDMAKMLEGKTGDAFDEAFIRGMIPHHQGAIDMARAVQRSAKHQEIRDMADDIIEAQQREIDMMRQWLKDWGYDE